MIPGPLFLYTVSEAFKGGQAAGIRITFGHLLVESLFVAVVVLGLRDVLATAHVRAAVAWVGGVGLVVMGALLLRKVRHLTLSRQAHVEFAWGSVAGGAFYSLISPGFLLWWATIGAPVFLQGALAGAAGIGAVAAGHAAADLGWHWFVAWSVERGRPYCKDATYRLIITLIGLALIALGIGLPLTLSGLPAGKQGAHRGILDPGRL